MTLKVCFLFQIKRHNWAHLITFLSLIYFHGNPISLGIFAIIGYVNVDGRSE